MAFLKARTGIKRGQLKYRTVGTEFESASVTYVRVQQMLNGIPVANGVANVAIKDNKVVAYGANFVNPKNIALSTPRFTPAQAIITAEFKLGAKHRDSPVTQEYIFTDTNTAILTFVVQIQKGHDEFDVFVDAQTGNIINVVKTSAEMAYRICVLESTKQNLTEAEIS
ncbi:hypothetical protein FRB99_006743 [Tulasnella sp. 403]|nr:hypothetical protein FRB99_006743 [Tulasnella sp. 403]